MRNGWLWMAAVAVAMGCWVGPARSDDMPAVPKWVSMQTTAPETGGPEPRTHHGAIYDPVGHRMVIFGGRNNGGVLDDTWSLDLKTGRWTQITGNVKPPARFGFTSSYDAPRRRMVIFSGQAGAQFFKDVWALDLEQNRWSELKPKTAAVPKARYGGAAIYDDRRERLVTFAGFTEESRRFNDTWAFDLKEERWIDLSSGGPRPVERCLLTGAHDQLGDRMIIYAGQRAGHLEDTWAFDLEKNAWTEIKNPVIPPGRFFSAMVYQPEKRRAILFGGRNNSLGSLDDTWILNLNGDRWERLAVEGDLKPAARSGHTAVYDPVGRRMLIFGGDGDEVYDDTWALMDLAPAPSP
jgi:hypothetical protein